MITDPSNARRILADLDHLVPEADAGSARSTERFRAATSRFVNGTVHDARRERLERRLAALEPGELARTATRLTRRARARDEPTHRIARTVPVACLAEHLGIGTPDALPRLIAGISAVYAGGTAAGASSAAAVPDADAATAEALQTARGHEDPALAVQLLVQAHLATAALIDGALRTIADEPAITTRAALVRTLRLDPPVPTTRRVGPDGGVVILSLADDGAPDDATPPEASAALAFGAGPRACPAPAHALAIAAAIVDALREAGIPVELGRTAGGAG